MRFIPISALNGDMIVDRGDSLNWYEVRPAGILETAPGRAQRTRRAVPLSVQLRLPSAGFRQS